MLKIVSESVGSEVLQGILQAALGVGAFVSEGGLSDKSKLVLGWIKSGVRLDFVHPESKHQHLHPLFNIFVL